VVGRRQPLLGWRLIFVHLSHLSLTMKLFAP